MTLFLEHQPADRADFNQLLSIVFRTYNDIIEQGFSDAEATKTQLAEVCCLLGRHRPTTAAIAGNAWLCEFGRSRTAEALSQFLINGEATNIRYISIVVDSQPQPFDAVNASLKRITALVRPHLKVQSEHFIAAHRFEAQPAGVLHLVEVVGWDATSKGNKRSKLPAQLTRPPGMSIDIVDINANELSVAGMSAQLWRTSSIDRPIVRRKKQRWKPEKLTEEERELEVRGFVIRSAIKVDQSLFGFGLGRVVAQSVIRELKARTLSLDLAERAPIRGLAISRAFAALPINAGGDRLALPAII